MQASYSKVLEVVKEKLEELGCAAPANVLVDFELGIFNAVARYFAEASIRACFFHLCQSVFRRVQNEGLQQLYNDPTDTRIRNATRQMCALAFVPVEDVQCVFALFERNAPQIFSPVVKYFAVSIPVMIIF